MAGETVYEDAVAAYRLPRIVELGDGLLGAAFEVMKLLPASHIVERALADGALREDMVVVETTSGTFGLGLAMVCALRGLRLHLVSDPAIEGYLYDRLVDLGATISVVREPAERGGYQAARLRLLDEVVEGYGGACFVPAQYDNPDNAGSYRHVADHLAEVVGEVGWLVGSVGSGGSTCGTVAPLREKGWDVRAAGVDTHGSLLFGQADAHRELRGLGNSLLPGNLDHRIFDEVHWLSAELAYAATRALHRRHALYMGPTSGAAYLVGSWLAKRDRSGPVVVLLPDAGHRYEATVYSDAWLAGEGFAADHDEALRRGPVRVDGPPVHGSGWQSMDWGRRRRADVCGGDGAADGRDVP